MEFGLNLVSVFPLFFHRALAKVSAAFLEKVVRYRRDTVVVNLSRSFPRVKYDGISKLAHGFYRYFTEIFTEMVWAYRASPSKVSRLFRVTNEDFMNDFMEKHPTVIAASGHSGNWELLPYIAGLPESRSSRHFSRNGINIGYMPLHNKAMDMLMKKIRLRHYRKLSLGGDVIPSDRLFRHILQNRDKGGMYILIADQAPPVPKVVTTFLNQRTAVFQGPEHISAKLKVPVVFLECCKADGGVYEYTFRVVSEHPESEPEGVVSARFMNMLEKSIDADRTNWLWSHKRWKRGFTGEEGLRYV